MTEPPLPAWAHRPGRTKGADEGPLEAVKSLVPRVFEGAVPADHPAFLYGLRLHDEGFFWEAHEVWEAVWMAAPHNGRDRLALRALIQIANAGLKRALNQPRAAGRLVADACGYLSELNARGPALTSGLAESFDAGAVLRDLQATDLKGPGSAPLVLLGPAFAAQIRP